MTTIEGNKLIAGFDDSVKLTNERTYKYLIRGQRWAAEGLKYHSSWDWLMPVVGKIESLSYEASIFSNWCNINQGRTNEFENQGGNKIEAVWKSVVQFIQWYNQQNPIQ